MSPASLLAARGIEKFFNNVHVLKQVDFTLNSREVHALVGANGAGKTTLMRTIAGLYQPDGGTISINGRDVFFSRPRDALVAGIGMVTQETSLAVHLSVLENIFLPHLAVRGRLDWHQMRHLAHTLIDTLQIDIQFGLDQHLDRLSMANRQIVEILKVLALKPKIIFLDEPTTSLSPYEANRLLDLIVKMAQNGHGVVLVSHRMEEIFATSNRVSVLREGRLVAQNIEAASLDANSLVALMVGRQLKGINPRRRENNAVSLPVVLRVDGLASAPRVHHVSFEVRKGEIVGLGGLVGAGRSETVEAIFGLRPYDRGQITLFGKAFVPHSPKDAIDAGIGFIGEDRRRHGLVPDMSAYENLTLVQLGQQKQWRVRRHKMDEYVKELVEQLGLDVMRLEGDITKFSGGMQQKIILARWLIAQPNLLILDEPTRGVDIETRTTLYAILHALAQEGVALIVISSDFEELLSLVDRVVVLNDGRSIADVACQDLTTQRLTMLSAPRSSVGLIVRLLHFLTQKYQASAIWFEREGEDIFCFECVASPHFQQNLPPKGVFFHQAHVFSHDGGERTKISVSLRGRQGQEMGYIALLGHDENCLPSCHVLERIIHEQLILHSERMRNPVWVEHGEDERQQR